jgi:GDP-L-fucose synthase
MPTNLYGPNDNFDLKTSHVLPAMIRKFHEAKMDNHSSVTLWGTGSPMREFLHVDDLANAVVFALQNTLDDHLYNVGSGSDLTIKSLAEMVQKIVGHKGEIIWDNTKPDGTPRKLMDSFKLNELGWRSNIKLSFGIQTTYNWVLEKTSILN